MSGIAGKLGAIFQEYSSNDKSKLLADFQDDETWTTGAGTQSDDGTNYRLGTESIKILENDNTGSFLYSDQNSLTLNLATFTSGAASDTADYIYLMCYVSDYTKVASIKIGFSTEATYDGDPSYERTISTGITTGWNYIKILKSTFTNTNMSNWTGIQSMRVGWTSTNSAINAYISFQALYLIDVDYDLILANNTAYVMSQTTLCQNWNLDVSCEMLEDTSLGDEWKTQVPGLSEFSVSIEKQWANEDNLDNLGTTKAIILYLNTTDGTRYEGLGILSSDSIETAVDSIVSESIEFTGTGEVYYTNMNILDT